MTSSSGGVGSVGCGRPPGIGPTIAMPWLVKSKAHETAMAATTTNSAPGSAGTKRRRMNNAASETTLTATVVPLTSPSSCSVSFSLPSGLSASMSSPRSLLSWVITSTTATPCR